MYGIVDCDNCYVSCERVFRPDLEGKPVVVLQNLFGILNKLLYSYILIIPNILCKLLVYSYSLSGYRNKGIYIPVIS